VLQINKLKCEYSNRLHPGSQLESAPPIFVWKILHLESKEEKKESRKHEFDHEACAVMVSLLIPPLFLESARMTKCTRKAWWQKTRESYQCMNLITTQTAPHNEQKVDVWKTCIIHLCFSHLNHALSLLTTPVLPARCHIALIDDQ